MVSSILPKNEQKIIILSLFSLKTQDSDFLFVFFGRIEDIIICFQNYLTFSILMQDTACKNCNYFGDFFLVFLVYVTKLTPLLVACKNNFSNT